MTIGKAVCQPLFRQAPVNLATSLRGEEGVGHGAADHQQVDAADEIVAAVAPELVEERLKELGQLDSSTKRRWMFWRR